ncbi:unnamed protein product [Mytilus coruscus]|uniref:EGF-like domain-containing protein n=1 Tax=Mytilus coruscus TaxID=42192 RepID=A0A6J8AWP8_MYTCO|nr:unnamed protein product [Mytilus coruscus]
MTNLYQLQLQNNDISTIESFSFMNLSSLRSLNLSGNNISHIEEHAFGNLTSLSSLYLTSNPLNCDCSIYSFWSWLIKRTCIVTSATCSNGTSVVSLQLAALQKCNPNNCQCFNGGTCVTREDGFVVCDCIGHWTGEFCQESQCISYDCGFGDCYIEPVNGTAQCLCGDRYVNDCPAFITCIMHAVAKCNLTKEEKEFLEFIDNTLTTDSATIGASSTNSEINSESVQTKAQEIARMDAENDYQEFVESLWNTRITNMINESESVITGNETITSNVHYTQPENGVENVEVNNTVQTSNRSSEKIPSQQQLQISQPLQDFTNSQMMRNTSLHQVLRSFPYYNDLYARRFIQHTDSGMPDFKRRHLETEIYMSENREEWDSSMYPEELFPQKSIQNYRNANLSSCSY